MFNARVLCLLYLVITPILIYKIIDHYESALKNEKQTFVFTYVCYMLDEISGFSGACYKLHEHDTLLFQTALQCQWHLVRLETKRSFAH